VWDTESTTAIRSAAASCDGKTVYSLANEPVGAAIMAKNLDKNATNPTDNSKGLPRLDHTIAMGAIPTADPGPIEVDVVMKNMDSECDPITGLNIHLDPQV